MHSVEQLQAYIQDLELQLAALTQHQTGSAPARPLQQAQGLLGAVPKAPGVPAPIMERLRSLAGAGPTRLGGHEKRNWALELTQNGADIFETLQQELEAGDGDELARMTADAFQDPMHKLLFFQMQQVTLLQKQVAPPTAGCYPCGPQQRERSQQQLLKRHQRVPCAGGVLEN